MACSLEDLRKALDGVIPADLRDLSGFARTIPRDQDTKINAGPFGIVTRIELRAKLRDYVVDAFNYSNFLYVLLRGPLSVNKDYTTSFADACNKYKFVITRSNSNSYLNPAYYPITYNQNLVIENAFDPNTGIQTMPKYQNAYKLCVELFSTKECPRELGLQLLEETRYDLEFAAVLYEATYRLERGGRKAKKTLKHSKKLKRKTSKKNKRV
jgi:hypothetical protein